MNWPIWKNKINVLIKAPQGTISAGKKKHQQKFHWAVIPQEFYSDMHSAITTQYPFPFSPFLQDSKICRMSSASSSNLPNHPTLLPILTTIFSHRQEQTLSATISIILADCIPTNLQNKFVTMWGNLLSAFHPSLNSILHLQWINLITACTARLFIHTNTGEIQLRYNMSPT